MQYAIKKSRFIKEQEASCLLSSLGIKLSLSKITLVRPILFETYKMNEIAHKFLIAGEKFMPEMHLRQPGFTYSAWEPFTKKKKKFKNLKKQEIQGIFSKMN